MKDVPLIMHLLDSSTDISKWYATLGAYGPRKLTFTSDKLPALTGIAKIYQQLLKDEYLASFGIIVRSYTASAELIRAMKLFALVIAQVMCCPGLLFLDCHAYRPREEGF